MAKITRVSAVIFAGGAAAHDIEQFGSKTQVGTPNYTNDPAVIQSLAAWADGWSAALVPANKSEYKQDRNAVDYVASYQIAYLLQQGIAEWDSATTYYTDSYVTYNGKIYVSLVDSNLGNTPPSVSDANWRSRSAQPTQTVLASGSGTYTPPAGCALISVRMVGGGGGASGNGGNTTFGSFTAGGGTSSGGGGGGGTASGGTLNLPGAPGGVNGQGGSSIFGGAGTSSAAAATNSGSGASGGGAGGYVEFSINSPSPSGYSYAVGAAGSGSPAGGSGLIIVTEYYY